METKISKGQFNFRVSTAELINYYISSFQNVSSPSNEPSRMKRVHQGVQFHQTQHPNENAPLHPQHQLTSHELDAKDMRAILTQLFVKTLDMRRRQKEMQTEPHHHYEGVFKESANIVKPPTIFDDTEFMKQELKRLQGQTSQASAAASTERMDAVSGTFNFLSYTWQRLEVDGKINNDLFFV